MKPSRLVGAALSVLSAVVAIGVAEIAVRRIDGFAILQVRLRLTQPAAPRSSPRDTADLRYVAAVPLASGVDRAWYAHDPPAHQTIPMTDALAKRYEHYKAIDPIGAFYAWNRVGLRDRLCSDETRAAYDIYDDFFVFDPPSGSPWPMYRHLSHVQPPGWFPTNQFGWRGPDVPLNKPPGTIRLAFLGSSKTIDPFGAPFSHIEYIGEWLTLWLRARHLPYRVEVINAARTGIDEREIAAILRDEVLPFEPDLVIDDGGNNFGPQFLLSKAARGLQKPSRADGSPAAWPSDGYSALSRRVHSAAVRLAHLDGSEPRKPVAPITWPADVNEFEPDITHKPLPMGMEGLLALYDEMRSELWAQGGQFALPSWIFMARDGLRLDLSRDLTLFNSLNWTYYPMTYAQLRRAADFYNRVFRAYAKRYDMPFLDVASVSPLDPDLFVDTVHMTAQGLRLEAWNYFQMIVPWLDRQIASGALPRPMRHPQDQHPGFARTDYPLVTRAAIQATCR